MTPELEEYGVVLYDPERNRLAGALLAKAGLYTPEAAERVRQDFMNTDTRSRYQVRRAKLIVFTEEVKP